MLLPRPLYWSVLLLKALISVGLAAPAKSGIAIFDGAEVPLPTSKLLNNSTIPLPSLNLVNPAFNLQELHYDPNTPVSSSLDVLPDICNFYHFKSDYGRPVQALLGTVFGREACLMWYLDPVCNQTRGWNLTEYEDMSEALEEQVALRGSLRTTTKGNWTAMFAKGTTAVECRYCMFTWFHDILLWRMSWAGISPTSVQAMQFGIAVERDKVLISTRKPRC